MRDDATLDVNPPLRLVYWHMIPGRGEPVRLALEEAGVPYVDVGRLPEDQGGGVKAVTSVLRGAAGGLLPFAPPVLIDGGQVIAQTACILDHLAARYPGLCGGGEVGRRAALQLELTLTDLWAEVHDTHHPIGTSLYFEEQKEEAKKRSALFVRDRAPKYLAYFEKVLAAGGGTHLVAGELSYVELSLAQALDGLEYAFPLAFERWRRAIPGLIGLRERSWARPRIAAYRSSERRIAFNEHGIFRKYPELDG